MMDDLLDLLDRDDSIVFTLDGQAVILEDYLEVRPEQELRLRRLINTGRIAIGPSYTLTDELLSGQESLIRNLLIGHRICAHYGGSPMPVGYAPDTFGHISQMPQILRGFGIDSFVFWRGLGDEADILGAAFWWESPDGSRVLAVRLLEGYANGHDLGQWTRAEGWTRGDPEIVASVAARRIAEFLARWEPTIRRSGSRHVLLGNGTDHQPLQRDLTEVVASCRSQFPASSFKIGSYQDYIEALKLSLDGLDTFSGELVSGREACVVRGVNSTRIYLKQANEAAERELLVAETMAALAYLKSAIDKAAAHGADGLASNQYPSNELRLAWRELLKNQTHDSISGCSIDEVHVDMQQRFRCARQIAAQVQRDALSFMAGRSPSIRPLEDEWETFSIINPLPWPRLEVVEIRLPPALKGARRLIADTADGPLPIQLVGPPGQRRAILLAQLPGFGARRVRIRTGTAQLPSRVSASGGNTIENEFYRIQVAPNGTLQLFDRTHNQLWSGFHWFEDEADRGDEYSFCPVDGDMPLDSRSCPAKVRVLAGGPLVAELEINMALSLPKRLMADRKKRSNDTVVCPIRTVVRLLSGVNRIEFTTTVTNRACDHRLRVLFPAPESNQSVRSEGHFCMIRRPARPTWNGRWREPPIPTQHSLGTVAAGKLAVFNRGLPEYEPIPNATGGVNIALTLLRCVGWLSRSDLSTRPGAEEPQIPTPDAQCLGTHTFEYAISLGGESSDADLIRASHSYRYRPIVGPFGADPCQHLSLEGDGFVFSSLKGAEDGRGVMLRIYNPGSSPTIARIAGDQLSINRCRLDETDVSPDRIDSVILRGGEIATLRILPRLFDIYSSRQSDDR